MLTASGLNKTFHTGIDHKVINGIDLTINEKDFVVISGKSGSGKSTLLYLLSGLERPSSGKVMFRDQDIFALKDGEISSLRRNSFGFVFQFYNLIPALNVYDNIFLPVSVKRKTVKDRKEQVLKYAEEIGIKDKLQSYPHQLSGGEQQRVAIVRALAIDPVIIFADEPTGNLDTKTSEDVLVIFRRLSIIYKKTIIMVTHDESVGKRFATRELYIENGKILS
jgi:putative ABC transport system ATP-binding protein